MLDAKSMISFASIKFMFQIMKSNKPESILKLYNESTLNTTDKKLRPKYKPKTKKNGKTLNI